METSIQTAGYLEVEINLQSGDTEDEMKRNFQLKQQKEEDIRAKEEEAKQAELRKKMQFVMEQAPIFAQLYIHIEKLGHTDNLGIRSETQQKVAADEAVKLQQEELANSLNQRANGTEEEASKKMGEGISDSLNERAPGSSS